VVATTEDLVVIRKIPTHLGLGGVVDALRGEIGTDTPLRVR
jgi:hypothetical protein